MNTGTPVVISPDQYPKLVALAKLEKRSIRKQLELILDDVLGTQPNRTYNNTDNTHFPAKTYYDQESV